jgi:putative oxidoreductase
MTTLDIGLLVLRVGVGLTFAAHGAQKAFGWWSGPGIAAWRSGMERMNMHPARLWATVSIAAELGGGLLFALGLLTPIAAAVLIAQSIVIIELVHWRNGFFSQKQGFEFPLVLAAGVLATALAGAGRLSLDSALGFVPSDSVRIAAVVLGIAGAVVAIAIPKLGESNVSPASHAR